MTLVHSLIGGEHDFFQFHELFFMLLFYFNDKKILSVVRLIELIKALYYFLNFVRL